MALDVASSGVVCGTRWHSVAIGHIHLLAAQSSIEDQKQSEAIRSNQKQSEAIRSNQKQSPARRPELHRGPVDGRRERRLVEAHRGRARLQQAAVRRSSINWVIEGGRSRGVIRGTHLQHPDVDLINQKQSEAIRSHQKQSEAITCSSRPSVIAERMISAASEWPTASEGQTGPLAAAARETKACGSSEREEEGGACPEATKSGRGVA